MAKIIVLKTLDNRLFKIDVNEAKMSTTIKDMLENLCDEEELKEEVIPVQVEGDILERVIEWAEYHYKLGEGGNGSSSETNGANGDDDEYGNAGNQNEMSEWNKKFFKVENDILFAITRAANYLDMKELLDVCCEAVGL